MFGSVFIQNWRNVGDLFRRWRVKYPGENGIFFPSGMWLFVIVSKEKWHFFTTGIQLFSRKKRRFFSPSGMWLLPKENWDYSPSGLWLFVIFSKEKWDFFPSEMWYLSFFQVDFQRTKFSWSSPALPSLPHFLISPFSPAHTRICLCRVLFPNPLCTRYKPSYTWYKPFGYV